jgi:ABC-type uncharacterized transport system substrate-binding protein
VGPDANAHPHAWVDVRSAPVLDEEGHLVAIEQEWFFDYFYSAFVREELEGDGGLTQAGLDQIAAENMAELEQFEYFTDVRSGPSRVALGEPHDVAIGYQGERLWLRFVIPLAAPVMAADGDITYAIYDPTYYIEMLHLEDEPIMLLGNAAASCQGRLVPPNPSMEAVALAGSMAMDAQSDNSLGELFSEWIHVTCP